MNASDIRLGILLPTRGIFLGQDTQQEARTVLQMAEAAEAHGVDSVWVGDSLTAKPRLEPLTTLAAVAACTGRVRIGTAVLLGALHQPVPLAQAVATLDILSGGRMTLGVGVGGVFTEGQRKEWLAVGMQPAQRAGRLEEIVTLLKRLWAEPGVTYRGRYFTLEDVTLEPRPVQRPGVPIWIACHYRTGSEAQYRRAALLGDGYISITDSPDEYAEVGRKVRQYAREAGRDPTALDSAFYMTVNVNHDEAKAQEEANAFILSYYGLNFWGGRWGPFGPPEKIISRIREYVQAGARTVILRFASFEQLKQLENFVSEVLPAFSRPVA